MPEKRYKTLRWLSVGLKFAGAATLGITILFFLFILLSPLFGDTSSADVFGGSVMLGLGGLVSGLASAVTFYATGEGIDLAINIEENTRATGVALNRLLARQAQRPAPPVPAPAPNPDSLLNRARQND